MKKGMCFLTAMLFAMAVLCQPILSVGASYTVYVCTDDAYLNIRTEPNSNADNIVSELADCQSFEVMKTEGNWAYGDHYNSEGGLTQGWIYLPYTRRTYEEARDNAGKAANRTVVVQSYEGDGYMYMRYEPTTGNFHNELCRIPDGTVLTVTRTVQREGTSGWGLVSYNGQQGWIYLKGVKDYVPEPEPTPVPTAEPVATPAPAVTPVVPTYHPTGLQAGTVTIEDDRIISSQMLVLILIGVAIFLVVTVAILLIVVLNRSKQVGGVDTYGQQPYYPQDSYPEPQDYAEQPDEQNAYYEENGQPYPEEELYYEEQPKENGDYTE